jgi:hypothetical protein
MISFGLITALELLIVAIATWFAVRWVRARHSRMSVKPTVRSQALFGGRRSRQWQADVIRRNELR